LLPLPGFYKLLDGSAKADEARTVLGVSWQHLAKELSAAMASEQSTEQKTNDAAPEKTGKRRILIVDDDPEIVEATRCALELKGYEVLIARDGNQGLAIAEVERPDLIILDMMMPKRSGFLVVEKLRLVSKDKVPIIMITANEGKRHREYAKELGVDEYFEKGKMPMDKLLDAIQRHIGP
jgi:CheY-like chemotaxis protein